MSFTSAQASLEPLRIGTLEAKFSQEKPDVIRTVVKGSTESGDEIQLSWADVLQDLSGEGTQLRKLLSQALQKMPFEAFFWECPPLSRGTKNRPFEFVVVNAPHLATIEADGEPFSEYLQEFQGQEKVQRFFNLGGDSLLVAPSQAAQKDPNTFAHIARFFRDASQSHQDEMWKALGQAVHERLSQVGNQSNLWVSTEGSGVYWLHMRIDPRPKYYHWSEYRNPRYGLAQKEL